MARADPRALLEKARGEDEGVAVFAIVVDGEVAGMIQHWEETDEEYRHAGIDLFLGRSTRTAALGPTRCGRWRAT